jgi:hypothetical protein
VRRKLLAVLVSALALSASAATAASSAPSSAPRFVVPPRAAQGQVVHLGAVVAARAGRCFLTVRYADGTGESFAAATPRRGRVSWRFKVASSASLGSARATVACARGGSASHSFTVVGPLEQPKIVVEKNGFSQRNASFGSGSAFSWGAVLANRSTQQDALSEYVLVNAIDARGLVIASQSETVDVIPAGGEYALGDSMTLDTTDPVVRLEIVLQSRASQPKTAWPLPGIEQVGIVPSRIEPGFVGEVDGVVTNGQPVRSLRTAHFSVVLLDAAGQVVGGGTGSSYLSVPPGARAVFQALQGFGAIPVPRAASALISVTPSWAG